MAPSATWRRPGRGRGSATSCARGWPACRTRCGCRPRRAAGTSSTKPSSKASDGKIGKIYDGSLLGNRVVLHSGTVVGGDGFGFAPLADGTYKKIHQIGNVIIEDDVEIGAGCTIDKGVSGDTIIGKGTKLDNHIHIGHGAVIGRNCLFAAQVGIGGKAIIEDEVILWGQVGVSKDLTIGKGAVVYAQSGVPASLEGGKIYFGSPVEDAKSKMRELSYRCSASVLKNLVRSIAPMPRIVRLSFGPREIDPFPKKSQYSGTNEKPAALKIKSR